MKKVLFIDSSEFNKFIGLCLDDKHYLGHSFDGVEDIESFFGIFFADPEGIPYKDMDDDVYNETETLTCERYTPSDDPNIPESYPAICCFEISNDFDRFGSIKCRIIEYIYLDDFDLNKTRDVAHLTEDYCCFGYDNENRR